MTLYKLGSLAAGVAMFCGLAPAAVAQTSPTTAPIAPGASLPTIGIPGIGPANVPTAPGAASVGVPTEQFSIGGTRLAPGATMGAGELRTPAVPGMRR